MSDSADQHCLFLERRRVMEGIRQYVFTLIVATLICTLLSGLFRSVGTREWMRIISGAFLLITAATPISDLKMISPMTYTPSFLQEASCITAEGEYKMHQALSDIIKSETETYIYDKASKENADLKITITIGEDYRPVSAELEGEISLQSRKELEEILEAELGITKEHQIWTGNP